MLTLIRHDGHIRHDGIRRTIGHLTGFAAEVTVGVVIVVVFVLTLIRHVGLIRHDGHIGLGGFAVPLLVRPLIVPGGVQQVLVAPIIDLDIGTVFFGALVVDVGQALAIRERVKTDGLYAQRQLDAGQLRAVHKCAVHNVGDTVGDEDSGQIGVFKRIRGDIGERIAEIQRGQRAVGKGRNAHILHSVADDDRV